MTFVYDIALYRQKWDKRKIMNVKNLSYINAVHFIFPFLDLNYKKSIILNAKYRFFVVVVLKDSNIS